MRTTDYSFEDGAAMLSHVSFKLLMKLVFVIHRVENSTTVEVIMKSTTQKTFTLSLFYNNTKTSVAKNVKGPIT